MAERNIKVLLVEDDKFDRRAVARYIQKMELPYTLYTAASSAEAMDMLSQNAFDVILLDYQLGDGTGLELLDHIRDTPAIFVTGSGSEEVAVRAMRQGAYDYLIKDPDSNYLTVMSATIQSVLDRKRSENALRVSEERYRGLAEFANAVIHNVGNVLNSITASCQLVKETMQNSKISQLEKVRQLLDEHREQAFLSEHPKGKLLPGYLGTLSERLNEEIALTHEEIADIMKNLTLIREIIATQQSQAKVALFNETFDLRDSAVEALNVCRTAILQQEVLVRNQLAGEMPVSCQRAKLTHILINLIRNAIESMELNAEGTRTLTLSAAAKNGQLELDIADTGAGFTPQTLAKLFSYGFTTKEKGHGFGLHYCANAIREMGGDIHAASPGPGQGSVFTIRLPLRNP